MDTLSVTESKARDVNMRLGDGDCRAGNMLLRMRIVERLNGR